MRYLCVVLLSFSCMPTVVNKFLPLTCFSTAAKVPCVVWCRMTFAANFF